MMLTIFIVIAILSSINAELRFNPNASTEEKAVARKSVQNKANAELFEEIHNNVVNLGKVYKHALNIFHELY
jgi:hypothetical protein